MLANVRSGNRSIMRLSNWMIGLIVAVLFAGTWVLLNRPVEQDPWTQDVSGLTYTPFRDNANPTNGRSRPWREVRRDLSLMAGLTSQIRTYSTVGANYGVPTMADKMGLRVMAGAWIDVDPKKNQQEIDNLVGSPPTTAASAASRSATSPSTRTWSRFRSSSSYIREVKRNACPAFRSAPRSPSTSGSRPSTN